MADQRTYKIIGASIEVHKWLECGFLEAVYQEALERELMLTDTSRFKDWEYPEIEDGEPTKYNWIVQHKDNLTLGYKTDIGLYLY